MFKIVFAIVTIAALVARTSNMLSSNSAIYTSLTLVVAAVMVNLFVACESLASLLRIEVYTIAECGPLMLPP